MCSDVHSWSVTGRKRNAQANADFRAGVDVDPDYGEGDTSTEEDAAFRRRIEDQDSEPSNVANTPDSATSRSPTMMS